MSLLNVVPPSRLKRRARLMLQKADIWWPQEALHRSVGIPESSATLTSDTASIPEYFHSNLRERRHSKPYHQTTLLKTVSQPKDVQRQPFPSKPPIATPICLGFFGPARRLASATVSSRITLRVYHTMRHLYSNIFNRAPELPGSSSSSSSSSSKNPISSKAWPWLSLLFGAIWVVPMIFVLSLSFREHIVGRSIGCLKQSSKKCQLDLHAVTQIQQSQTLAKSDEEAQAGLQIAAKSLEAWFCFICASLVWTVLKQLAGQDDTDALPVGYLHVHTKCQDLRLLPKLAWGRRRDASRARGRDRIRLYLFIAFLTCICILCNCMKTHLFDTLHTRFTPVTHVTHVASMPHIYTTSLALVSLHSRGMGLGSLRIFRWIDYS
ncbi:hypothetical protein E6O75_ATG06042 [Venturia nashicola]|uniref:Uncharacterized protein n=1 Tax=Venturia nashicola TaxID=86259 RepID=A0A4Z1PBF4_9PEZI|nr:hypothetical protein E6O75_ATG06042 [Venturia nashicola]